MNYLVMGVNGMAGHMIAQYLIEQGRHVVGFARKESPVCETIIGDALYEEDIDNALNKYSYDVVINAIGILNKKVDEDEKVGFYTNAELPHILADKLKNTDTKLIHISTDCVFAGTKSWYNEKDIPDAKSLYGISKIKGEVIDDKNLNIRTSIIGPELKTDGIGLYHWFMHQDGQVSGYKNVIWSGITTLQLAKFIIEDESKNITGLYHLTNGDSIPKYDLLVLLNDYCRKNKVIINANTDVNSNKSLETIRKEISVEQKGFEDMVIEMAEWIENHKGLYGQYIER